MAKNWAAAISDQGKQRDFLSGHRVSNVCDLLGSVAIQNWQGSFLPVPHCISPSKWSQLQRTKLNRKILNSAKVEEIVKVASRKLPHLHYYGATTYTVKKIILPHQLKGHNPRQQEAWPAVFCLHLYFLLCTYRSHLESP